VQDLCRNTDRCTRNPDAFFIFRFTGAFATAATKSKSNFTNGVRRCNVFWIAEGAISMGDIYLYERDLLLMMVPIIWGLIKS
jgi:hypothetical protein